MRRFTNTHLGMDSVAQTLRELEIILGPLHEVPFLSGRKFSGLELSTTELRVQHGLRQKPEGFIVLTQNAAQVIYESSVSDLIFINLKAGGAVTADV